MALEFDRQAFLDAYVGYLATDDDSLFWAIEMFSSDRCDEGLRTRTLLERSRLEID